MDIRKCGCSSKATSVLTILSGCKCATAPLAMAVVVVDKVWSFLCVDIMQRLKQLKDFDKARRFKQRKETTAEATGSQRAVKETARYKSILMCSVH